jgi:hypothetical protein
MGVGEEDRGMSHGWKNPQERPEPPEPMSRETAEAILQRHGLDAAGLEANELKRRWQELARRHHPDLGGDMQVMQEINAACAFLKPRGGAAPTRDTVSPRIGGLPVWAWAGHGAGTVPDELILRHNYTDRNFLKKRLWELSGRSKEEWTLWAFDGREMLPPVVAYGSDAVFPEMAEAMLRHGRRGFRTPRAILAQAPHERYEALLLHADGRLLDPPVAMALASAGGLAHDRAFLIELAGRLDTLGGRRRA